jgi:cytochrome-b5 reductase
MVPSLSCSPVSSLVPPGKCQFTPEFAAVPLLERTAVSETTSVLRFGLPDSGRPLDLSTCACILAKADTETEVVVRPYTPISTNATVGSFDLLVKHYDGGKMSQHMKRMAVGATLEFKHIAPNVKLQAPFAPKKIGMLVGGTGITPMIQALHHILGDATSPTTASMLYGSKVASDILGEEMLEKWSADHAASFAVAHVLSDEPAGSAWKGERGFIDAGLIATHLPGPELGDDVLIFVCGPPPMYDALCGPRTAPELTGVLAKMGYKASQVFKF